MKLVKNEKFNLIVHTVFAEDSQNGWAALKEKGIFEGKANQAFPLLDESGQGKIYYGLGKKQDIDAYKTTKYFHKLAKYLQNLKLNQIHLEVPSEIMEDSELSSKVFEGLYQAEYNFNDYKKDVKKCPALEITMDKAEDFEESFITVENVIKGIFQARELVNQPANVIYPESLAEKVEELFQNSSVEVEVFDRQEIEALGMKAYLAVHQGSDREPRFIVMKYMPLNQKEHLTLVGKGMTYDSGGYAIKSAPGMATMKSDMAGAAAVIGAMHAIAENKIQQNVVAVVAAAENLIDGKAFKNGDIISSMKGTTIEVNNTDAEGRLTLADAIYYAATELSSTAIVDVATLTGAAVVALGPDTTAMVSNNDDLAQAVLTASEKACEPTHRLPAFPSHYEKIKGNFADLDNAPRGGGGAITAGLFLEHFAEEIPWVHLDIAGPSFAQKGKEFLPAGASGTAVKTLYRWISAL